MPEPQTYHELVVKIAGGEPREQLDYAKEIQREGDENWSFWAVRRGLRTTTEIRLVQEVPHA